MTALYFVQSSPPKMRIRKTGALGRVSLMNVLYAADAKSMGEMENAMQGYSKIATVENVDPNIYMVVLKK